MGAPDPSNKEQYDGSIETGAGTEDDGVQGQDGVTNRGRCDSTPRRRLGQEHLRSWQGSETSFYQGTLIYWVTLSFKERKREGVGSANKKRETLIS